MDDISKNKVITTKIILSFILKAIRQFLNNEESKPTILNK